MNKRTLKRQRSSDDVKQSKVAKKQLDSVASSEQQTQSSSPQLPVEKFDVLTRTMIFVNIVYGMPSLLGFVECAEGEAHWEMQTPDGAQKACTFAKFLAKIYELQAKRCVVVESDVDFQNRVKELLASYAKCVNSIVNKKPGEKRILIKPGRAEKLWKLQCQILAEYLPLRSYFLQRHGSDELDRRLTPAKP